MDEEAPAEVIREGCASAAPAGLPGTSPAREERPTKRLDVVNASPARARYTHVGARVFPGDGIVLGCDTLGTKGHPVAWWQLEDGSYTTAPLPLPVYDPITTIRLYEGRSASPAREVLGHSHDRRGYPRGVAPRPRARCDPLTEQRFERRACRACGPRTWRKVGERSRQRDASSLIPATFEAEAKGADAAAYQLTVFLGPAFVRPAPGGVGSIFGWTPFVPTLLAIARKAARSNPANRGAARSHAQARVAPGEHGERG